MPNDIRNDGHYSFFRDNCKKISIASTPSLIRKPGNARPPLRRYSLAAVSEPSNSHIQNNASYVTRSPGFWARVVPNNAELQKQPSQSRHYGLGSFPIVHFFKKDLPILKPKISSDDSVSDISSHNTPDHNKLLLERIVRSNSLGGNGVLRRPEVTTKSVLDALREISRKRIHSDEEDLDRNAEGKRFCRENSNDSVIKNDPYKPIQKEKVRKDSSSNIIGQSIDEVRASHSSTEWKLLSEPKKVRIDAIPSPPTPKPALPALVNAQTQTPPPPPPVVSLKSPEESVKQTEVPEKEQQRLKKPSPIKIFDEKPLETMRRNKLLVLMGAKTNDSEKKPPSPIPEKTPPPTTTLTSILVDTAKSAEKISKHVTFDIPEPATPEKQNNVAATVTSPALVTPIVFPSVVESSSTPSVVTTVKTEVITAPTFNFLPKATEATSVSPDKGGFKFDLKEASKALVTSSAPPPFSASVSKPPTFNFTPAQSLAEPPSFKLATSSAPSITFAPTFSFGVTSSPISEPAPSFAAPVTKSPTLKFGQPPAPSFSFFTDPTSKAAPAITTPLSFNFQSAPTPSFGVVAAFNPSTTTSNTPFGFTAAQPTTTVRSGFSGAKPLFASPATTTTGTFGSFAPQALSTTFSSNQFFNSNPTASAPNVTPFLSGFSAVTTSQATPFSGAKPLISTPQTKPSQLFSFGSNNSATGTFSFASGDTQKAVFAFGGAEQNTKAFGGGGLGAGFGAAPTPQFNAQQGSSGMFNIGSGGASTPRSRTTLKPKRRA